jgi:hypothetical protein
MQSRFDSIAAAKAWNGATIPPNQEALILINGIWTRWRFAVGSTAVDTHEYLVFAPTTNGAVGKWLYAGNAISLKLPWLYNTANDTVLLTVPDGFRLYITHSAIAEITTSLTGNDAGALGINSSVSQLGPGGITNFSGLYSAGNFVGVDGQDPYTPEASILLPGATLLHNDLTGPGLYTGGAGVWHVVCNLLQL